MLIRPGSGLGLSLAGTAPEPIHIVRLALMMTWRADSIAHYPRDVHEHEEQLIKVERVLL